MGLHVTRHTYLSTAMSRLILVRHMLQLENQIPLDIAYPGSGDIDGIPITSM